MNPAVTRGPPRSRWSRCCIGWNRGGYGPTAPFEMSHGLVSALTGRLRNYTAL